MPPVMFYQTDKQAYKQTDNLIKCQIPCWGGGLPPDSESATTSMLGDPGRASRSSTVMGRDFTCFVSRALQQCRRMNKWVQEWVSGWMSTQLTDWQHEWTNEQMKWQRVYNNTNTNLFFKIFFLLRNLCQWTGMNKWNEWTKRERNEETKWLNE